MNKKGFTVGVTVIFSLVVVLAVAFVIIAPGIDILFSSSSTIAGVIPSKCNKALELKDYHNDVVMFASRTMASSENPFYDPQLSIQNFIQYLDCRNKEYLFDLNPPQNKKMDNMILICGAKVLDYYEEDLKKQMQADPSYERLNAKVLKDLRKARPKILRDVQVPAGNCEFSGQLA
ncbi:hypothetical protein ACFL0V_04790 [Nanoarchaeota archaeon]